MRVEKTKFADGLDAQCKRNSREDDTKGFGLSNWKKENGAVICYDGNGTRRENLSVKINSSFLACLIDIQAEMASSTWIYESEIQAVV